MNQLKPLTNGIWKENPVLVLLLGTCPTLALSTQASNAIGMGIAATFVLVCSNFLISILRNFIPDDVRLPIYIVIVASFVTVVQLVIKGFAPALDQAMGIYIPLIVVNCIILARAEMFAGKNKPFASVMDGLGMGIGFTIALLVMGMIREFTGAGTLFGANLTAELIDPIGVMIMPAGGFFTYGIMIAAFNKFKKKRDPSFKPKQSFGCEDCPVADICGGKECPGSEQAAVAKEGNEA